MKMKAVFENYFSLPCKKYLTVEKCKEISPPVVKQDSANSTNLRKVNSLFLVFSLLVFGVHLENHVPKSAYFQSIFIFGCNSVFHSKNDLWEILELHFVQTLPKYVQKPNIKSNR